MARPLTRAEIVVLREKVIHFALRGVYLEDERQQCIRNEYYEREAQRILDRDRQFTAELARLEGLAVSAASVHGQAAAAA
jgi:hypothetical protein